MKSLTSDNPANARYFLSSVALETVSCPGTTMTAYLKQHKSIRQRMLASDYPAIHNPFMQQSSQLWRSLFDVVAIDRSSPDTCWIESLYSYSNGLTIAIRPTVRICCKYRLSSSSALQYTSRTDGPVLQSGVPLCSTLLQFTSAQFILDDLRTHPDYANSTLHIMLNLPP